MIWIMLISGYRLLLVGRERPLVLLGMLILANFDGKDGIEGRAGKFFCAYHVHTKYLISYAHLYLQ